MSCAEIRMFWKEAPEDNPAFLVFDFGNTHIWARCHCKVTGQQKWVTKDDFLCTQANIQRQFAGLVSSPYFSIQPCCSCILLHVPACFV